MGSLSLMKIIAAKIDDAQKKLTLMQADGRALSDTEQIETWDGLVLRQARKEVHRQKKCPAGHPLVKRIWLGLPHSCDGCGCDLARREELYRCSDCDFDLCMRCAAKDSPVVVRVTALNGDEFTLDMDGEDTVCDVITAASLKLDVSPDSICLCVG